MLAHSRKLVHPQDNNVSPNELSKTFLNMFKGNLKENEAKRRDGAYQSDLRS